MWWRLAQLFSLVAVSLSLSEDLCQDKYDDVVSHPLYDYLLLANVSTSESGDPDQFSCYLGRLIEQLANSITFENGYEAHYSKMIGETVARYLLVATPPSADHRVAGKLTLCSDNTLINIPCYAVSEGGESQLECNLSQVAYYIASLVVFDPYSDFEELTEYITIVNETLVTLNGSAFSAPLRVCCFLSKTVFPNALRAPQLPVEGRTDCRSFDEAAAPKSEPPTAQDEEEVSGEVSGMVSGKDNASMMSMLLMGGLLVAMLPVVVGVAVCTVRFKRGRKAIVIATVNPLSTARNYEYSEQYELDDYTTLFRMGPNGDVLSVEQDTMFGADWPVDNVSQVLPVIAHPPADCNAPLQDVRLPTVTAADVSAALPSANAADFDDMHQANNGEHSGNVPFASDATAQQLATTESNGELNINNPTMPDYCRACTLPFKEDEVAPTRGEEDPPDAVLRAVQVFAPMRRVVVAAQVTDTSASASHSLRLANRQLVDTEARSQQRQDLHFPVREPCSSEQGGRSDDHAARREEEETALKVPFTGVDVNAQCPLPSRDPAEIKPYVEVDVRGSNSSAMMSAQNSDSQSHSPSDSCNSSGHCLTTGHSNSGVYRGDQEDDDGDSSSGYNGNDIYCAEAGTSSDCFNGVEVTTTDPVMNDLTMNVSNDYLSSNRGSVGSLADRSPAPSQDIVPGTDINVNGNDETVVMRGNVGQDANRSSDIDAIASDNNFVAASGSITPSSLLSGSTPSSTNSSGSYEFPASDSGGTQY